MRQNRFGESKLQNICKGSVFAVLSVLLLCSCGKNIAGQEGHVSQSVINNLDSNGAQKNDTAENDMDASKNALEETARLSEKPLYQGVYRSCILQEDEEYLYLCGSHRVSRINKATKTEEILWQNKEQVSKEQEYLYRYGSAFLLDDKIYFIERWYDEMQQEYRALSMVHTDGSGYERIKELDWYCSDGMLLENGLLYIDGDDGELCYLVYEDGTLSAEWEVIDAPDRDQIFYDTNGDRVVFQHEDISDIRNDAVFCAFNEKYLLFSKYVDGRRYFLVDRKSGDEYEIGMSDEDVDILYMDDEFIYMLVMQQEQNYISYVYKRYILETGEWQLLFSQEKEGYCKYVSRYLMDVIIKDDFIYYVDEQDGKYYLMKCSVNQPETAEAVWEAFYDTGIGSIGRIKSDYQEYYYSEKEKTPIFVLSCSWLQVNDSFQGAKAINAYLTDYVDAQKEYVQGAAEEMREWVQPENILLPGELSGGFVGFQYFDSRYISFYQATYEYMSGAAHGMPYWNGMTFDLQTGKRLYLEDIINNCEEELKEIVTAYFAEMINLAPDAFWGDAVEYVREDVSFESDFYMTEEGFVFFYEPYALACYAAGFQSVTIPYEEFDMKITLEKADM